jgi:hypothetical protein
MQIRAWLALVLLTGLPHLTFAQAQQFGDWRVELDDSGDFMYAATINDSGEILGEYCYFSSEQCNWILGMATECDEGDTYVLLGNSSKAAKPLDVTCLTDLGEGVHVYAFEWKELESVIKGAKWVGMAFPMQGDAFTVVRFSLDGIDASTRLMETGFKKLLDSGVRKKSTKTQIM